MTTIGTIARKPVQGGAGKTLLLAAERAVGYARALRRAMRNRRSVEQLLDWDGHMLDDIGLTRGDVLAALDGSIGDDPAHRLSTLSLKRRAELRERLILVGRPKAAPRARPRAVEI